MKTRFRKFTAFVLALVMVLTMLPLSVFAAAEADAIPVPDADEFKQMSLYSLRNNGARMAYFTYATGINEFIDESNLLYPDSWYKLVYVIEKSQYITLELYTMEDLPEYTDVDVLLMEYDPDDTANGEPGSEQMEEFIGEKLGVVVAAPVPANVAPLDPSQSLEDAPQVIFQPIDDETWWDIIYRTVTSEEIDDRILPQPIDNYYAFGFNGQQYGPLMTEEEAAELEANPFPVSEETVIQNIALWDGSYLDENDGTIKITPHGWF